MLPLPSRLTAGALLLLTLPALAAPAQACALVPNPASCADDMAEQAEEKAGQAGDGAGEDVGDALDLVEGLPAQGLEQAHDLQGQAEEGFYGAWYQLLGELREAGEGL